MANLNYLFGLFNSEIKLNDNKAKNLIKGRDALRSDIRSWFEDKGKTKPKFSVQGSFAMKTTINPLPGDEYDLDDGVYLQGYNDYEVDEFPVPSTVHNWIKDATDDRTKKESIDKNTCVRVNYADDYHIDLPIYIIRDEVPYLAHKAFGWTPSDPKEFTDWFLDNISEHGEQLRRIVRYLKAWKDYKNVDIESIEITILACENFEGFENRDDKAIYATVSQIIDTLEKGFICEKPSLPYNDLFEDVSDSKKNNIISRLKTLRQKLNNAIIESDEEKAAEIMREVFGSRFPKGSNSKSSSFQRTSAPGVLKHDGRSG